MYFPILDRMLLLRAGSGGGAVTGPPQGLTATGGNYQ